jgi:hypothetical protein
MLSNREGPYGSRKEAMEMFWETDGPEKKYLRDPVFKTQGDRIYFIILSYFLPLLFVLFFTSISSSYPRGQEREFSGCWMRMRILGREDMKPGCSQPVYTFAIKVIAVFCFIWSVRNAMSVGLCSVCDRLSVKWVLCFDSSKCSATADDCSVACLTTKQL